MENLVIQNSKAAAIAKAWESLLQEKPAIRIREAAKELNTSEAVLLATKTGEHVVRLKSAWPDFMTRLPELGHVMSLTRNDYCILEHKGGFQKIDIIGGDAHKTATVIGPIETRAFFKDWHIGFAVAEEKSDRVLKSFQVFDKAGDAVTKIYLQEKSNEDAFYKLLEDFRSDDQSPDQNTTSYPEETFADNIDKEAFLADWSQLKDTHDFFGLLRKHKAQRHHALELASGKFTHAVDAQASAKYILETAADTKLPIMIFAGNRGNIQIHQGKVKTIRLLERGHNGAENWLNVLDPDFNMHLRQDHIYTAWVVEKPTTDGVVTSVELFDKDKNMIVQFFGLRKAGIVQQQGWTDLVKGL